jgi:hypothetical protein
MAPRGALPFQSFRQGLRPSSATEPVLSLALSVVEGVAEGLAELSVEVHNRGLRIWPPRCTSTSHILQAKNKKNG